MIPEHIYAILRSALEDYRILHGLDDPEKTERQIEQARSWLASQTPVPNAAQPAEVWTPVTGPHALAFDFDMIDVKDDGASVYVLVGDTEVWATFPNNLRICKPQEP